MIMQPGHMPEVYPTDYKTSIPMALPMGSIYPPPPYGIPPVYPYQYGPFHPAPHWPSTACGYSGSHQHSFMMIPVIPTTSITGHYQSHPQRLCHHLSNIYCFILGCLPVMMMTSMDVTGRATIISGTSLYMKMALFVSMTSHNRH